MAIPVANTPEHRMLVEIGALHERVRKLRMSGADRNITQIKSLEGEARTRWEELRRLRAGPAMADPDQLSARGLRR